MPIEYTSEQLDDIAQKTLEAYRKGQETPNKHEMSEKTKSELTLQKFKIDTMKAELGEIKGGFEALVRSIDSLKVWLIGTLMTTIVAASGLLFAIGTWKGNLEANVSHIESTLDNHLNISKIN